MPLEQVEAEVMVFGLGSHLHVSRPRQQAWSGPHSSRLFIIISTLQGLIQVLHKLEDPDYSGRRIW